ncbi:MAG: hypothetical protein BRD37_08025 [Bacteroidetes bacterium QH_8_67_23]|nr:MAG: hypothetical protein BRD37_08025 [Bacteroidetes bacterium QH_8_67_23]
MRRPITRRRSSVCSAAFSRSFARRSVQRSAVSGRPSAVGRQRSAVRGRRSCFSAGRPDS